MAALVGLFVAAQTGVRYWAKGVVHIYSDSRTTASDAKQREMIYRAIQDMGFDLPARAEDLYLAWRGNLFADRFAAFRLGSIEECEGFFKEEGIDPAGFTKGDFASEGSWRHFAPPHTWGDKCQNPNWRLSQESTFLYMGRWSTLILYVPEECRVYLFEDNGP